jgi:S-adenosylmethionine decarboxylase
MTAHAPHGLHCLADLSGVRAELLIDCAFLEATLREAAKAAGAQVLFARFHSFGSGLGVTGVVLLAESHVTIHTWPEARFAALDIFLCGRADTARALQALVGALAPESCRVQNVARGVDDPVPGALAGAPKISRGASSH